MRLLAAIALAAHAAAQSYMIVMRDGVKLGTQVDLPIFYNGTGKIAAVVERSPYGAGAEELIATLFGEFLGYASVRQDMRGTHTSEGNFGVWHDSKNDFFDTAAWIIQQPWSNGVVFSCGASADAIDEIAQIMDPHPALRGQVIIWASGDGWGTFYPGGAYRDALIEGWLRSTVPSQSAELVALIRSQEQPGGTWWDAVNGTQGYMNVNWPTLMWGGWYDIFQQGQMEAWRGYQYSSQPAARGLSKMVVDPCGHCQAAASLFPTDTAYGRVILPILMAFDMMSNESPTNKTWPPVPEGVGNYTVYVMGADETPVAPGNYWTSLPAAPVPMVTPYYLGAGGVLSPSAPTGPGSTTYTYDPTNPVPTIGGNNLEIPCGPLDQAPIERLGRQDVLIFTSAPLEAPLALAGPLAATLFFSSNVTETDYVVKLIDVYPVGAPSPVKGESVLVADGIVNTAWRDAPYTTVDKKLTSGDPTDIYSATLSLWETAYVFQAGHRIRIHVQSSNFPRFYPSPNTGAPMSNITSKGNLTAASTIYFDATRSSHISLPVVPLSALPQFPVEVAVESMLRRWTPRWEANVPPSRREEGDVDLRSWIERRGTKAMEFMVRKMKSS